MFSYFSAILFLISALAGAGRWALPGQELSVASPCTCIPHSAFCNLHHVSRVLRARSPLFPVLARRPDMNAIP